MPSYSNERREAVVAKLMPPRNLPVREVAQQEGISEPTVYKWRKEAREQGRCLPNAGDGGTAAWSSKDKFGAVLGRMVRRNSATPIGPTSCASPERLPESTSERAVLCARRDAKRSFVRMIVPWSAAAPLRIWKQLGQ